MTDLQPSKLKFFLSKYAGVLVGALYGLAIRFAFGYPGHTDIKFTDLFSITFVWIVPVIIGITPMLFASRDQLSRNSYKAMTPLVTVFVFFIFCFITRIEDLVCIIVISIPFLIGAVLGGLIFGRLLFMYKERRNTIYSILLVPFIAGFIEEQFKIPTGVYHINTTIVVNATPHHIWQQVVRVKQIKKEEYEKGFFNYAGIPRPLYAELDKDTVGAIRTGHFEGGLKFIETVDHWEKDKKVSFNISVIPSSVRNTVFDKHILTGKHFKFLNASYTLKPLGNDKTELCLSSSYRLDTRINYYASFWGNSLLSDFQQRLLDVIKHRCEQKNQ
jgi:hypothetical protein